VVDLAQVTAIQQLLTVVLAVAAVLVIIQLKILAQGQAHLDRALQEVLVSQDMLVLAVAVHLKLVKELLVEVEQHQVFLVPQYFMLAVAAAEIVK
jgi:hypothetical protein